MNGDRIARLERLAKLRDQGILSPEEFDAEKARLLTASDQLSADEKGVDAIAAPIAARISTLTGGLLAGIGALVFIVLALVAMMVLDRDGHDGSREEEDSQAVTEVSPVPLGTELAAALPPEPDPETRPVAPVATAGTVPPKITSEWRYLRTRILEGWGTEPTFDNRYVIIRIGCGTGCTNNIVGDHRTGELYPFDLSGEGYDQLQLRFDNGSNRLTARWGDIESQTCITQGYRWTGIGLEETTARETSPRVDFGCDELGE